jgi:glycosyltransferase involved in cell wall biosynthesis
VRILCVGNRYPPWSIGGYEASWAAAVEWFRRGGHSVRVLTTRADPTDLDPGGHPPPDDVHRELRWYWRAHAFPPHGPAECLRLERANASVLRRHLDEFHPDIVMWWAMGGMSLSLLEQARRAGVPALAVVGDEWLGYGPQVDGWTSCWRGAGRLAAPGVERFTGIPTRLRLDRAARWSFNSEYTRSLARTANWRLVDARVDHPGVGVDRFASVAPLKGWSWRLLCLGRIDPRKGVATALEVLPRLPPGATLVVHGTGDPNHLADLEAFAERLGIAGRVTFSSGPPQSVPPAFAACDALVFPVTWREPWGLVPLEAMAAGRPVVASRAGGGAAEYLRDGHNCLQFEPDDAGGLAYALSRLAADPGLRDTLVRHGHATAARYTEHSFHETLSWRVSETIAAGPLR